VFKILISGTYCRVDTSELNFLSNYEYFQHVRSVRNHFFFIKSQITALEILKADVGTILSFNIRFFIVKIVRVLNTKVKII